MNTMRGGGSNMAGSPVNGGSSYSAANFPTVQVGAADSRRYYAPTAGYGHAYQTFKAPSPVPALMLNTPYDARAFNPACIKTGGSRKRRRRRTHGGAPVAFDAGSFSSLKEGGAGSRYDFDFTRFDAQVYMEGFDLAGVSSSYRLNQILRVVVIPASFGKNSTVNLNDYNAVVSAFNIDESKIIKM
jgi:hypothetical protein